MSTAPVAPAPQRSSEGGVASVPATIVGALLALAGAVAVLVAFGLAIAQLTLRDDDGYYTSPSAHLATPTSAIVGSGLSLGDVDGGASADVVDALSVTARITATARRARAVFVGIGPTAAVDRYLAGAAHAQVDGVRDGDVLLRTQTGTRRLAPPGSERFWVASAAGAGQRQVTWKASGGRWSAVVMNADGARGVDVDVRVGAKIGALPWIAGGIGLIGLFVLIGGGVLMLVGLRPTGAP
jgi:hypothetical protein